MTAELYPAATPDLARMRRELALGAAFAHSIIGIAEMSEVGPAAANDHPPHARAMGDDHGR